MRELDELLVRYLDECYPQDNDADKAAFREVLELAAPALHGYLLQRQMPSSETIARVIDRRRRRDFTLALSAQDCLGLGHIARTGR